MCVCIYEKERGKEIVAWFSPPPLSFVTSSVFLSGARRAYQKRFFCLVISPKRMRDRVNRAINYHTTLSPDDDNNDGGFK